MFKFGHVNQGSATLGKILTPCCRPKYRHACPSFRVKNPLARIRTAPDQLNSTGRNKRDCTSWTADRIRHICIRQRTREVADCLTACQTKLTTSRRSKFWRARVPCTSCRSQRCDTVTLNPFVYPNTEKVSSTESLLGNVSRVAPPSRWPDNDLLGASCVFSKGVLVLQNRQWPQHSA